MSAVRAARRTEQPMTRALAAVLTRSSFALRHGAGLLKLLAQLTVVGDVSRDAFVSRVRDMAAGPEHVLVVLGA
jgi:hypothetical protein